MNPEPDASKRVAALRRFARFAAFLLLYNIPVIVYGAFVRASGSGDGCGSHWPLCDGQFVPLLAGQAKRAVEFTHRITTGIDGPLVLALVIAALRLFPRGHRVRTASIFVLFFTIVEALFGAVLVRKGLVAGNTSPARAVYLALHLINTFLLLGSMVLTAWWASPNGTKMTWRGQGAIGWGLGIALLGTLILGASGAVTALGDTLYPVSSHAEAMAQSLAPGAHFLVRLRVLHPLLATSVGLCLLLMAGLVSHLRPSPFVRRFAQGLGLLFAVEMGVGLINIWLKAPIPMQLIHLLVADLVWVNLVLFSAAALAEGVPQVERSLIPDRLAAAPPPHATWRDYVALTKPRVISLLLFTTLAAMVVAAKGWPGTWLFLAVAVGGYLAAGAANAINMVVDRDIDLRMKRTSTRPTVTESIPAARALSFAFGLAVMSFALLWWAANLMTAMLALSGLVFYVTIYTLFLKRRTWHNIVIGGAAGSIPPLVGWAAVTGELAPLAWILFGIVFVWTPVHFWALALLIKDDYAEAGIPMLPVVRGDRITGIQIGLYAIVTAAVSIAPWLSRDVNLIYAGAAILLNVVLLGMSAQLYLKPDRPRASRLFHYSMLYLALLFLAMAVDRTWSIRL